MKKILVSLLALSIIVCFVGCENNNNNQQIYADSTIENEEQNVELRSPYTDDQVLFAAQDRCDTEDDRTKIYSYNYKGESINTDEAMSYIGYYSENGLAPAVDQGTGNVGFVDKEGVFQIEPKYEDAAPFSPNGIALVKTGEYTTDGDYIVKYGYINSKGEEIVPLIYDYATSFFNCGYALAKTDKKTTDEDGYTYSTTDKHYIIDEKGNTVIEIDVESEQRGITAVYKDYYVCEYFDSNEYVIFDFSGKKLYTDKNQVNGTTYTLYVNDTDCVYKYSYEGTTAGEYNTTLTKKQKFDGKKFVDVKDEYEITSKRVATTQSGFGYGLEQNGKIKIPFEYDSITQYGEYFVAVKYTGYNTSFDQVIDIYDKNFNKTAENIEYAFYSHRNEAYGERCQLPNGYFQIVQENDDYGEVCGIIDYTGKIIMEPIFGRGIILHSYEGMGNFSWNAWI